MIRGLFRMLETQFLLSKKCTLFWSWPVPPLNHFVLWLVSFSMFHQLSEVAGTQAEANLSCNFIARKASILQSVLQYQQTMTIPWLKMGPKRFFFGCRALASIGPQENSGLLRYTETSVWPNSCQRSYVATKDGSIHCSWWRPTIGMESSEIPVVGDCSCGGYHYVFIFEILRDNGQK